jgi:hypothetical protein
MGVGVGEDALSCDRHHQCPATTEL